MRNIMRAHLAQIIKFEDWLMIMNFRESRFINNTFYYAGQAI